MTGDEVDTCRIRDAFEQDLAGYRAPADFGERARAGGLRRARSGRIHRAASVAAACAAVVTALVFVPLTGTAPPLPRAGLPWATAVGRAMLTAFNAANSDIVYEKEVGIAHGTVTNDYQSWFWPAQPVPGQQVRERAVYAQRVPASARSLTLDEDYSVVFAYPRPRTRFETVKLTMVCYQATDACGWGPETPVGTWSKATFRSPAIRTDIAAGSSLNPVAIARQIIAGDWRVVRRTRLEGQPAIELRETRSGAEHTGLALMPVLLWVSARTHLPIRWIEGVGTSSVTQQDYAYLPPTRAKLALLRVPIPRGYPRSNPARN